jgi:hypothetical protein
MGVLAYICVLPFCRIVMFHMKIKNRNGQAICQAVLRLTSTRDANRTNLGEVLVIVVLAVAVGVYVVVLDELRRLSKGMGVVVEWVGVASGVPAAPVLAVQAWTNEITTNLKSNHQWPTPTATNANSDFGSSAQHRDSSTNAHYLAMHVYAKVSDDVI